MPENDALKSELLACVAGAGEALPALPDISEWVEDPSRLPPRDWAEAGLAVLLLAAFSLHGDSTDSVPALRRVYAGLVLEGVLRSAVACGTRGVMATLASVWRERSAPNGVGAVLTAVQDTKKLASGYLELDLLIGDPTPDTHDGTPYRADLLITTRAEDAGRVLRQAEIMGATAVRLGTTGGEGIEVRAGERVAKLTNDELLGR